ncbi:hypothetical protein T09_5036 [Trichinella sp. T9]|nr:hypothetical protein T09_5036 [Trichinella sp. T9]
MTFCKCGDRSKVTFLRRWTAAHEKYQTAYAHATVQQKEWKTNACDCFSAFPGFRKTGKSMRRCYCYHMVTHDFSTTVFDGLGWTHPRKFDTFL